MSLTDRWQTPLRGERLSDLLLQCANYRNTDSSLPLSGRDSYLLKMARRSWMTSQLSPFLERDMLMFSVLTNYSGWLILITECFLFRRQELTHEVSHPSLCPSLSLPLTPESVLTKQFWHDSRQSAVRLLLSLLLLPSQELYLEFTLKLQKYQVTPPAGSLR